MAKKAQSKKQESSGCFTKFLLLLVILLVGIPLAGAGIFLSTFDINSYKGKISEAVAQQTGRELKLVGPISWSLSLEHGISIGVSDVTVSNPSWASRPLMARIGNVKLHVNLIALLSRKLDIVAFELSKADVQLETGPNGAANWDFKPAGKSAEKVAEKKAEEHATKEASPVSLQIQEVKVTDSRFGFKDKDGKLSLFEIPDLTFTGNRKGVRLHFNGKIAGTPADLDLAGGKLDAVTGDKWPFNFQAVYAEAKVDATGELSDNIKKINLQQFALTAGPSKIVGNVNVAMGGARPVLRGALKAKHFDPSDLSIALRAAAPEEEKAPAASAKKTQSDKIFSSEPLPFDGLKAADVFLDLEIEDLIVGATPIQDFVAKLTLENGKLVLSPFTGQLAGSKADGQVKLDASAGTPDLAVTFKAPSLDLSKLFQFWGVESVFSGKADVGIDLTSAGRSMHDLAGHSNGAIRMVMDSGTVSNRGLQEIAGSLLNLFAPGAGGLAKPGLNCAVVRFKLTNGLMESNGILVDTDMTTVAGTGLVNLADEHISMNLKTKPKALGLTSVVPPMKIYGPLSGPSFTLDAGGAISKVAGLLTNGVVQDDGVPTLLDVKGANACEATLDNPKAAAKASLATGNKSPLIPGEGNIQETVKGVGGKLLQGIGKGIFGQ